MWYKFLIISIGCLVFTSVTVTTALAQGGWRYTVQPHDTLASIAAKYNAEAEQLARANGMTVDSWLQVGQRLVIPTGAITVGPSRETNDMRYQNTNLASEKQLTHIRERGQSYTVQVGDTFPSIASYFNIPIEQLREINNLAVDSLQVGQTLIIPETTSATDEPSPQQAVASQATWLPAYLASPEEVAARWILVDLSDQTVTAYQGVQPVFSTLASTGLPGTPTVQGEFNIYVKYEATRMIGGHGRDYYDLPNVPHTMYFYEGYALHGAYWHNNFGYPMSHGCVNLSLPDAKQFYDWATVGTRVVVQA